MKQSEPHNLTESQPGFQFIPVIPGLIQG